ncbi:MAG: hypothetical protein JWR75_1810 [Devosia sp.]|nr:hypothetical protein [Devosia sp.]
MAETDRTVAHGSFTVERRYPAAPARVFNAFADPAIKGKWFGDPEKDSPADVFEFRPGGREVRSGVLGDGTTYAVESRYYDIVDNQRIVYAYDVIINGARTSVSVATVELTPDGAGTRITMTEHGAFLDGIEVPAERQGGAEFVLDRLGVLLAQA